jgi:hypothetical protein
MKTRMLLNREMVMVRLMKEGRSRLSLMEWVTRSWRT